MPKIDFPVNPIRDKVYSRHELFSKFEIDDEDSYVTTLDFKAYHNFVQGGGSFPNSYYSGMMRSLHDFSIWNGVQEMMENNKIVAIMGGHKMDRNAEGAYANIARIACRLTSEGYLLTSGGGPGAMEATHLGAYFSKHEEEILEHAIKFLAQTPKLPKNLSEIINGSEIDMNIAREIHAWIKPVFELMKKYPHGGESLSVPTWMYGHEPSTPLASHIAKYYQNSIREDGLLAIAKYGVIYAEGKAGTIQEIFQDATQNFYKSFDWFSPMVFLGKEYWTEKFPVKKVLDKLIPDEENAKYLIYTDDIEEAVDFLNNFKPE